MPGFVKLSHKINVPENKPGMPGLIFLNEIAGSLNDHRVKFVAGEGAYQEDATITWPIT